MKYVHPLPKMVELMQFSYVLMTVVNKATKLLLKFAVLCSARSKSHLSFACELAYYLAFESKIECFKFQLYLLSFYIELLDHNSCE